MIIKEEVPVLRLVLKNPPNRIRIMNSIPINTRTAKYRYKYKYKYKYTVSFGVLPDYFPLFADAENIRSIHQKKHVRKIFTPLYPAFI